MLLDYFLSRVAYKIAFGKMFVWVNVIINYCVYMNKQTFVVVAIVLLLLVGSLLLMNKGGSQETQTTRENSVAVQTSPSPETDTDESVAESVTLPPEKKEMTYTLEDVAPHSKAEDCWIVIEGNVYDMTPYIQKQIHPGGAAILFGCGKDATAVFNLRPKDNKPHSQNARDILKDYYLGALGK